MAMKPAWALGARQGPLRRHKQIVFFACEGLVAMFDERVQDEEYIVVTPTDFASRARGLGELGQKMAKGTEKWMRQDGRGMLQAANDMEEAAREAKDMGDPSDPAVQAFWAKHRRNSTIRVKLSAGSNPEGYPELPEIPLGKFTGRTADCGDPVPCAASAVLLGEDDNKIRRKPRKKPRRGGLVLSSDFL